MAYARIITALGLLACVSAPAFADSNIQEAIKRREDLSMFYQALVNTGVWDQLSSGSFTVFAPTNEAFEKIPKDKYPCFYSPQCKDDVAAILQHHIIKGEVYVDTVAGRQGGIYTVDSRFLTISEVTKGRYSAGGNSITSTNMLGGDVLYKIDGVIADKEDLVMLRTAKPDVAEEQKPYEAAKPDAVADDAAESNAPVAKAAGPSDKLAPAR